MLDLVVERDGLSVPVEVKHYSPDCPLPLSDVHQQAARLHAVRSAGRLQAPILVVFGRLTRAARAWSQEEHSIRVWDIEELRDRAQSYPELLAELERFTAGTSNATLEAGSSAEGVNLVQRLTSHMEKNALTAEQYEELCREVFYLPLRPRLIRLRASGRDNG